MKKDKSKDLFLEQLKKIPIIQVACEKTGIGRTTYYRWKREDKEFAKAAEAALLEGEAMISEMAVSQTISLMKDKHWPAISFWLRHRDPRFRDRIEVIHGPEDEALTPEQEKIVREALRLGSLSAPPSPGEPPPEAVGEEGPSPPEEETPEDPKGNEK